MDGKPFFLSEWFRKGILSINELLNETGNVLTFQEFRDKYSCESNFLRNMSKTRASASSRVPNTEKQMKARGRRPSAFICFEVFGTRDEARSPSFWHVFSNETIINYVVTCFLKTNNDKLCSFKAFFALHRKNTFTCMMNCCCAVGVRPWVKKGRSL